MLNNDAEYKYETPYKGPLIIKQFCTNGTVTLQCGLTKLGIICAELSHIHLIKTLKILTLETNDWRRQIRIVVVTYLHQSFAIEK